MVRRVASFVLVAALAFLFGRFTNDVRMSGCVLRAATSALQHASRTTPTQNRIARAQAAAQEERPAQAGTPPLLAHAQHHFVVVANADTERCAHASCVTAHWLRRSPI
jgi:hypothetical protein